MKYFVVTFFLVALWSSFSIEASSDFSYYVGVGRYDITGPSAGVEMVRQWIPFVLVQGFQ